MVNTRKFAVGVGALALGSLVSNFVYRMIMSSGLAGVHPADDDACPALYVGEQFGDRQVQALIDALERCQGRATPLVIHTFGGELTQVVRAANAVHAHGEVTAIVPYRAFSGGSLVALAAKEIVMWPDACLGAVDPQITFFSAHALKHAAAKTSEPKEEWLALAFESERTLRDIDLLLSRFGLNQRAQERMINLKHSHAFPISIDEARSIGLPVKLPTPEMQRTPRQSLVWRGRK